MGYPIEKRWMETPRCTKIKNKKCTKNICTHLRQMFLSAKKTSTKTMMKTKSLDVQEKMNGVNN